MAIVKRNIIVEGLSGKLGDQVVFSQRGGKTIVSVKAVQPEGVPTEGQVQQRTKFGQANRYAKQAMKNAPLKEAYEQQAKKGQNGFNVAMADYLNAPEIISLNGEAYSGAKDSPISITVTDDHMVAEVEVILYSAKGSVLEQGPAELDDNGVDWVYTTQKTNGELKGSKLVVRASDLPGNLTEREFVLG